MIIVVDTGKAVDKAGPAVRPPGSPAANTRALPGIKRFRFLFLSLIYYVVLGCIVVPIVRKKTPESLSYLYL